MALAKRAQVGAYEAYVATIRSRRDCALDRAPEAAIGFERFPLADPRWL